MAEGGFGKRFNRVKKLASGLQGHIYLCRDQQDGDCLVAVKEVSKKAIVAGKSTEGDFIIEDFKNERRVLSFLSSQPFVSAAICRMIAQWEYCGAQLSQYLSENMEPINVRNIFQQCVQCVHWMHIKGVCHLDLCLENIMLVNAESSWIKITDFG